MEKYLRVGVITSPHGVRGEVKVYPTTDDVGPGLNKSSKKTVCGHRISFLSFPADGLFYLPLTHKYRNESPGSHEDDSK